ncbi:MAG: hypothetical protein M3220_07650 [Chloroflexota bacterium]|nr:hypothetical protein [Chloroflexota bacterium]
MWNLVCLVLDDESKLDDVLAAWEQVGIPGATILGSTGLARRRGYLRDDVPLFPSLSTLLQSRQEHNITIFTIVDKAVNAQRLLAATEAIIGDLSDPHTGIFFVAPLALAKGIGLASPE